MSAVLVLIFKFTRGGVENLVFRNSLRSCSFEHPRIILRRASGSPASRLKTLTASSLSRATTSCTLSSRQRKTAVPLRLSASATLTAPVYMPFPLGLQAAVLVDEDNNAVLHSRATHLSAGGTPIEVVSKKVVRHSSVQTTYRFYRGITKEEIMAIPRSGEIFEKSTTKG